MPQEVVLPTPAAKPEPRRMAAETKAFRPYQTNQKFSDACNLRLLGLRATIEVLKQPPVIAKQERAGEGD